ncbi:uncharacterized protein LOC122255162 [Penaeus japonicus]|uniref:uncharacterized protein LOC122255162 n=1 Tax=Penaeus japonicus TaxID=27405 RepID=UPI001C70EA1A|nr:uncharacterized protein LOC122255162 [Penaeus japonicus]
MSILALLLVPAWLAVLTVAQGDYCLPPLGAPNDEVAADYVLEASGVTTLAALESEMSFCCQQQFTGCQNAGGVCMPSYVRSLCPHTVDNLCPSDSCTCCIFRLPCKGLCNFGGKIGQRLCGCQSNERAIQGKCPSGDEACTCCPLREGLGGN